MDSRPNNVAVGCTTTYDSATMRLVWLFRETSLKNGINQNSHGSSSGRRTITDLSADNANENASGGKESLVARSTEDCQQTKLRDSSKVRLSLPVSTLRNTTNPSAYMHKCVRRCSHVIININSSGYKRRTYRQPCISRNIPASNCRT